MLIRTNVTGIGDPFVITDGKLYYMYATSSPDGFKVWKSSDLVTWEDCGLCLDMRSSWACNCFWAPEVIYHNGKYLMHFTARKTNGMSLRTGVAISDSPLGPFKCVNDGPMFERGFATIDATVFVDDDNQGYVYFCKDVSENIIDGKHRSEIFVAKTNSDLTGIIEEPVKVLEPDHDYEGKESDEWRWNEGPFMIKRNGIYFLTYSANCFDNPHYCIGLATAKSPYGPFTKLDKPLIYKELVDKDFSGPGHNNIFTDMSGNLKIAFHIHTDETKPSGDRKAVIADIEVCGDTLKVNL